MLTFYNKENQPIYQRRTSITSPLNSGELHFAKWSIDINK